jgi:dienelactone hydrolase
MTCSCLSRATARGLLLLAAVPAAPVCGADRVQSLQTPAGVRFALRGEKPAAPAPTLFVFATAAEPTLAAAEYNQVGRLLAGDGWLCVALDVPCHGQDVKDGEKPGDLAGWRKRLERGEELLAPFAARASAVLDHLVKQGYADPARVAACGTSRGGFAALHFAAAEPRVRSVAAFAPVTDLLLLREFAGTTRPEAARALALDRHADKLAGRGVWLCIGNHDERVGTDAAIAFTRRAVQAAVKKGLPPPVELHVTATPGHTIHATAHDEAAAWFRRQIGKSK